MNRPKSYIEWRDKRYRSLQRNKRQENKIYKLWAHGTIGGCLHRNYSPAFIKLAKEKNFLLAQLSTAPKWELPKFVMPK